MTPIADLLARATPIEGGLALSIPADWLQGRTAYGGLSSALALHAAQQCEADLPPLRSVQVAFIGPLAGDVTVKATKLRRGRTAAFIQADIAGAAGLGFRATFVFMADQPSSVDFDQRPPTDRRPPGPDAPIFTGPEAMFLGNFNFHDIREGLADGEVLRWGRLISADGLDPMVHLLAIADALPPAAIRLFGRREFPPVSTLTWTLNLLTPLPATTDRWWLISACTSYARGGYSGQTMAIWNADGQLVAQGAQGVAIFA